MAKEKEEEKETEAPKKKGGKGLLIIIIVLVIVLAALVAAYFLVIKKPVEEDPAAPVVSVSKPALTAEPGPMQSYPPFLVNLADPGGQRYLKVTIAMELDKSKNFPAEVAAKEPKIKDIIVTVLSSKTYEEISTAQGKTALKQEILRKLNTIMSSGRIMDVYITEFIVQ